ERGPDTVRGADVSYYSYHRLPRGEIPGGYLPEPPELVFEVRSPSDRWSQIIVKAGEYLESGVVVVCVHDVQTRSITVYRADQPHQTYREEDELDLSDVLPDFRLPVRRFFD